MFYKIKEQNLQHKNIVIHQNYPWQPAEYSIVTNQLSRTPLARLCIGLFPKTRGIEIIFADFG